jgi:isopentenyl-diphosphate delta-isomerase
MDELILVNASDEEVGHANVTTCHQRPAKRHRAVSVFLFNSAGEMLITQRSGFKKTWPLYWSNACCGHPRKGETCEAAAPRRLSEELGVEAPPLSFLFKFEYSAQYNENWEEHEVDWVFAGRCEGPFPADPKEVAGWKFIDVEELRADILRRPEQYTPWFKICLDLDLRLGKRGVLL